MFKTNTMDLEIKKDLVSNWFKLLQEAFCNDISILENNKMEFKSTLWKKGASQYAIVVCRISVQPTVSRAV